MLKGFLSVLAGLGLYMVLFVLVSWGLAASVPVAPTGPSTTYIVTHLVLVGLAAFGGGILTAGLAPGAPMMHVLGLAVFVFLLSLPALFLGPAENEPALYPAMISVAVVAGVLLGGRLGSRSTPSETVPGP